MSSLLITNQLLKQINQYVYHQIITGDIKTNKSIYSTE